ncbi:MAG: putative RNA helicase [Chrysothrix sp. TS-e1954]|nr:MAG: putative RNA helicase [Chrysothrix sp. TS-e1954]
MGLAMDSGNAIKDSVSHGITTIPRTTPTTFTGLGLAPNLIATLATLSIKRPTPIQAQTIPKILEGCDAIGGSKTGTGKTLAFALPIIERWSRDPSGIFAVVLTPTRELALQIFEQFKAVGSPISLKPVLVTGGSDMLSQATALCQRPHVVIATPGRLADHVRTSGEESICGLRRVKFVVLDEADRLLSSGPGSMLPDLETCLSVLPASAERQTCLFTATVTPEVRALKDMARPQGRPPVFVCEVETSEPAVPHTLRQTYLQVPVTQKESYLHVMLQTPANESRTIIIFVNAKSTADFLHHMLRLLDHRVTAIHSGLSQTERNANLAKFRAKAARIMVATDVAARGLDIEQVRLVVNYDLPRNVDDYVHRVGRTARIGKEGTALSLVGQRDVELLIAIEERVGSKMTEYQEANVSIEGRVIREGLKAVGEKKRQAMLQIEEGREVTGKRKRGKVSRTTS